MRIRMYYYTDPEILYTAPDLDPGEKKSMKEGRLKRAMP